MTELRNGRYLEQRSRIFLSFLVDLEVADEERKGWKGFKKEEKRRWRPR